MQKECRLSIITINYNGLADTCALLSSISMDDQTEAIVVDNHSAADEATLIEQRFPQVTVVRSDRNLGFAGGNNLGVRAAHGKYLFFVNNDTEFCPGYSFDGLIRRLEENDDAGVVCPKIRFFWGSRPIQYAGYTPLTAITMRNRSIGFGEEDHGQYDTPHPTPYAHGAAMLVRRDALERAGLMPECYFLYYEELDWSMMFRRAGFSIWYDPSLTIFHKESQTTGQGSALRSYYIARNRLLFARRNTAAPRRYLTYAYLIGIVALRDVAQHLMHRRTSHARAVMAGLRHFFLRREGYHSFTS